MQSTPLNRFDDTLLKVTLTEAAPRRPRGTGTSRSASPSTVLIGCWLEPRWVLAIDEHGFVIAERGDRIEHLLEGYEGSVHDHVLGLSESPVGLARRSPGDHAAWWGNVGRPTIKLCGTTLAGAHYGPGVRHMLTHPDQRVTPIMRADIHRLRRCSLWNYDAPPLILMSSLPPLREGAARIGVSNA